jgi:hypothetical protein
LLVGARRGAVQRSTYGNDSAPKADGEFNRSSQHRSDVRCCACGRRRN